METKDTACCPPFKPQDWDDKTFYWDSRPFVKAKVFTFFYMPLNFSSVMSKLFKQVQAADAVDGDNICLSEHTSKWSMDIYLAVTKPVEGAQNVTFSGKFVTTVYEGSFKDSRKWFNHFVAFTKSHRIYFWYTTCSACAKQHGKNYVVLFGKNPQ